MNRYLNVSNDDCKNLVKKKLIKNIKLLTDGIVNLLN